MLRHTKSFQKSLQPIMRYKVVWFWTKLLWNCPFARQKDIFKKMANFNFVNLLCFIILIHFRKIFTAYDHIKGTWSFCRVSPKLIVCPKRITFGKMTNLTFVNLMLHHSRTFQKSPYFRPWDICFYTFWKHWSQFSSFLEKGDISVKPG